MVVFRSCLTYSTCCRDLVTRLFEIKLRLVVLLTSCKNVNLLPRNCVTDRPADIRIRLLLFLWISVCFAMSTCYWRWDFVPSRWIFNATAEDDFETIVVFGQSYFKLLDWFKSIQFHSNSHTISRCKWGYRRRLRNFWIKKHLFFHRKIVPTEFHCFFLQQNVNGGVWHRMICTEWNENQQPNVLRSLQEVRQMVESLKVTEIVNIKVWQLQ